MRNSREAGTSLLHNKVYIRIYTAYATSTFGDWFDALAIQVLVGYRWQASPLMLALIPVSLALPGILLGSVAGVAADRLNKLRLMRICDLFTAILTVLVLFAPNMAWLLPLLMLRAAISTLNVPAQASLTRSIVHEDQLLQATSLNGFVNQGSKIAGPLIGGFALTLLTPQWCILLNSGMRLCSFLLLLTIKHIHPVNETREVDVQPEQISMRTMWKEGWSFMLRSKLLLNTMLYGLIGTLAIQVIDFQFTSLFRLISPNNESLLGWMVAASGAGAIAAIMVMNKTNGEKGYGWRMGSGGVLIGIAIGGLGMLQPGGSIIPVLLLGVVLGIGNGVFIITFNYCLQKETPPHMTGRVIGIQNTLHSVLMIGAPLLGGILVQGSGPARIFLIFGTVVALVGVGGILLNRVWWPERKEVVPGETMG
ncbi:MAG: MFS transporter [Paenibacillus sp.]|nr:MFS transporter [Paenibacillus sp.]